MHRFTLFVRTEDDPRSVAQAVPLSYVDSVVILYNWSRIVRKAHSWLAKRIICQIHVHVQREIQVFTIVILPLFILAIVAFILEWLFGQLPTHWSSSMRMLSTCTPLLEAVPEKRFIAMVMSDWSNFGLSYLDQNILKHKTQNLVSTTYAAPKISTAIDADV